MKRLLTALGVGYARSLLFALWSGLCVSIGAAWMLLAIKGVLHAQGIL